VLTAAVCGITGVSSNLVGKGEDERSELKVGLRLVLDCLIGTRAGRLIYNT
jgi:hypothetical protein